MKIDSMTFHEYYGFFRERGYFPFTSNFMVKTSQNARNLLLMNYTLQLHYSDCCAFSMFTLIENSVERGCCSEEDLMDYFITYLWRLTEFKNLCFLGKCYHVILLPKLENENFSQFYKYAYQKYLEYCKRIDKDFQFIRCTNLSFSAPDFCWDKVELKSCQIPFLKQKAFEVVYSIRTIIESIVKSNNPYSIDNRDYDLLITTHPKTLCNPKYNYEN
jgi:hypothetical protein